MITINTVNAKVPGALLKEKLTNKVRDLNGFNKITSYRNGNLLLEVSSKSEETRAKQITDLDSTPVTVELHRFYNHSKGVVRDIEFRNLEEDEIVDMFSSEGVTHAYKFKRKFEGQLQATNSVCLTFTSATLPTKIHYGWRIFNVATYVPLPLRCYNCNKFGHSVRMCRTVNPLCAFCSSHEHPKDECPNKETPKCLNCNGKHPSFDRKCPTYVKEK